MKATVIESTCWVVAFSGDTNSTRFEMFFDQNGRFYSLKAPSTTSFLPPFGVANVVVTAVPYLVGHAYRLREMIDHDQDLDTPAVGVGAVGAGD